MVRCGNTVIDAFTQRWEVVTPVSNQLFQHSPVMHQNVKIVTEVEKHL